MFTPDEIEARIRAQPFVPVRIVTSSGQSFDIYHPDLLLIGRRSLEVGSASNENPKHYERVTRVAIMHITALEDLPSSVSSSGNGQS
jgi:hypothetical protein